MRLLVVGCNPSPHNLCKDIPFLGTKSGKVLMTWLEQLQATNYITANAVGLVSKSQKGIKASDIEKGAKVLSAIIQNNGITHVISLGDIASKAVKKTKMSVNHMELPHPSPLNRKLNNKAFVAKKLQECKEWLAKS